ncbi:Cytochrome c bioproteinis protein ResB [Lentibacillus sp. JNUCC-1]|uniref:cytochrome c biogenesis protein ResB n=1 Tax=Lentibacillus sp. JNUCC-1 TaxID=2654513 RepID=UPI0012E75335|nr:cytochrome c biogenesis protein ResB [Lentibacillus sp. JNUCC-1]MUV39745.1 Cytochrome c bioproteinis protein ResB [Lentibacillus sp. JNUCC-1]
MKHIKCECGHVNPEGTVLCEACGKPVEGNQHIDGNDEKKLLNMRYEGSARRSQTYNKSIIDKIWSFFSSVKVGVWLIVLALIASAIGTIYPQRAYIPQDAVSRDPAIFYESAYGLTGKIFYQLGFHELYSSWWYMILIALIGVSLVICSLDRFLPLHKALKNQKAKRHKTFLERQRLFSQTDHVTDEEKEKVINALKKQKYKVRNEDGHILAEKGRFSRWGPYVNHIGLIIILLAALLRTTPWMYLDEYVWVREGEQKVIPGTNQEFYIENKEFILETYDEDDELFGEAIKKQGVVPSNFQTNATIYRAKGQDVSAEDQQLEKYDEAEIYMNNPYKFEGYSLYQAGYQLNEFSSVTFAVGKKDEGDIAGQFKVDLNKPRSTYELDNGIEVAIRDYYPDYYMGENGPKSRTDETKNPAFVFKVTAPDVETPEVSFVGDFMENPINFDATGENEYVVELVDAELHNVSGLTVRRDYTLPFFGLGAAIFMIGVIQGMYWQHRRIWLNMKDDGVLLAAHTNKNWFGLKKDIDKVISDTDINNVNDQQELE